MEGIRPCPYCQGEVEVIKLIPNEKEKAKKIKPYRIECRHCHMLVARGVKFPIETDEEGKQRIEDYERYQHRILYGE